MEAKTSFPSLFNIKLDQANHIDLRSLTYQQAMQCLISQKGDIELLIQHVPQPPGLKVTLSLSLFNLIFFALAGGSFNQEA